MWNHYGDLRVNEEPVLTEMGESVYVAPGASVALELSSGEDGKAAAYVVGNKFLLDASGVENVFTSSWAGPTVKLNRLQDAVDGIGTSLVGDDPAICNGTSLSRDFLFGSRFGMDPPVVTVANCAEGSDASSNFVWSHFHPYGAVYLPFSGEICFVSDKELCAMPGTARWPVDSK